MSSGNQHNFIANRNCPTNSLPYGYGGRIADISVFPVKIIMLPTSSRTFLVGKNARSATALINWSRPPRVCGLAGARLQRVSLRHRPGKDQVPTDAAVLRTRARRAIRVVCCAGVEGLEHEELRDHRRDRGLPGYRRPRF